MIFLTFANGWKYRENRENQIPQNFQSHLRVTPPLGGTPWTTSSPGLFPQKWEKPWGRGCSLEIPVECAACRLKICHFS